jgi:hypothetical protein
VGKSDALEISFGVSEPTAEQVFVRLQHQDKPIVKTFPTSGPSSGVFVYKLVRVFDHICADKLWGSGFAFCLSSYDSSSLHLAP